MIHLLSCCSTHDACKGSILSTNLTALAACLDFRGQYQTRNEVADSSVAPSTSVAGICVQARASSDACTTESEDVGCHRSEGDVGHYSMVPTHALQISAQRREGLPLDSAQAGMWPSNHSEGYAGAMRPDHDSSACASPDARASWFAAEPGHRLSKAQESQKRLPGQLQQARQPQCKLKHTAAHCNLAVHSQTEARA